MTGDQPPPAPPPVTVDARGWRCPWPVVRLARALREGAATVDLLADDPSAAGEIATFAELRGLPVAAIPGGWRVG